jgi:hypothetical protein
MRFYYMISERDLGLKIWLHKIQFFFTSHMNSVGTVVAQLKILQ